MKNDKLWAEKAEENKDFLIETFTKINAEEVLSKITKSLWSTTYLYCIRECELFWPPEEGRDRKILDKMLTDAEWEKVTSLACWVWEERFVRSGFTVTMGCKLVTEILTVILIYIHLIIIIHLLFYRMQ
jgi:hypothetical protein